MKRPRPILILCVSVLLALAGTLASSRHSNTKSEPLVNEPSLAVKTKATLPFRSQTSESITQQAVDLIDRHVIAGGGGTSIGGSIRLDGTVGEVSASSTLSGGSMTLNGGFWNALQAPVATPTPLPGQATILVEAGTNRAVALDSVTFVRGPFTLTDNYNFSSDHRTRIIFFTTNLGFTQPSQPDVSILSVEIGGLSLPVESAGPLAVPVLDASYIVFRLPDLTPGDWPLGIRLRGVFSSNSPTLTIVLAP